MNPNCKIIPHSTDSLCAVEHIHYEGVLMSSVKFYLIRGEQKLQLNTHQTNNSISSFGGFAFSDNGKYLYLSWADEGHPYFIFFDTDKFIHEQENAGVGHGFEDYYLYQIISFTDQGDFVYQLMTASNEQCQQGNESQCQVVFNILTQ